jgi:long-chain acyl-CoA synthetase
MRQTIFTMIQNARAKFGDRDFTVQKTAEGWKAKSFNTVFDEARLFAACLFARGYTEGDKLAIYAEGGSNWFVSEYGIISAGCIAVPLSFKLLPDEAAYRLEHSEARAVITNANHAEKIAAIIRSIADKTGRAIDLFMLDENFQTPPAAIGLIPDHYVRMDEARANGAAALERYAARLDRIAAETQEDAVVSISYTSGTTGNPKGIMLSHKNYYINSLDSVDTFRIPEASYIDFVVLPVDHSFAQTVGLHASVQRGISVWFVDARGGGIAILRNLPENLKECSPTFMLTVPALTSNFMKKIVAEMEKRGGLANSLFKLGIASGIAFLGDTDKHPATVKAWLNGLLYLPLKALVLNKVKVTVFGGRAKFFSGGGASFDIGQQRFFRALGMPLYQGYGMTEASPVISSNTEWNLKLGTSGKALPNVEIRVVKEDGSIASHGEKGEICARGPNLMQGYFKNPDATAQTVIDGWLHTGDLGWLDAEGFLTVAGRAKALLISADGEKYSPEGIEDAICNAGTLVNQAIVWNDHRKFTMALITLDDAAVKQAIKQEKLRTPEELLEAVKDSFYSFKSIKAYINTVPANWTPATFQLIGDPFTEAAGLVNSTMKIVRYKVVETYAELIEYVYTNEGSNYRNVRNLDVVKRYF